MKNCTACGAIFNDTDAECPNCAKGAPSSASITSAAMAQSLAQRQPASFARDIAMSAAWVAPIAAWSQFNFSPGWILVLPAYLVLVSMPVLALVGCVRWRVAKEPEKIEKAKRSVIKAFAWVLAAASIIHGQSHCFRRIESRMAPLIAAVAKYKKETGEYPVGRDDLVPKYLAEVPLCANRGAHRRVSHHVQHLCVLEVQL